MMFKIKPMFLASALLIGSGQTFAEDTYTLDFGFSFSAFDTSDDDQSRMLVAPLFSLGMHFDGGRDVRHYVGAEYGKAADNGTNTIRQSSTITTAVYRYEKRLRYFRSFKPHYLIGLKFKSVQRASRYEVDGDGYLVRSLKPKTNNYFYVSGGMSYDIELNKSLTFVPIAQVGFDPFSGGGVYFEAGASVKYSFDF